jgi:hypothetical protein
MSLQSAVRGKWSLRDETPLEQSVLQPLAILDAAFASRHMLGLTGINQQDFKTSLFELLYNEGV